MLKHSRARVLAPSIVALHVACAIATATPPPPAGDAQMWDSYWQGLVALREDRLTDALKQLDDANQRNPGDANILLSRGVAHLLLDQFDQARADLAAVHLPGSNREPQLWNYAIEAMTNFTTPEQSTQAPRSLQKPGARPMFMGVPGNMIQGADDYTTAFASCVIYEFATPYRTAKENRGDINSAQIRAARHKAGRWFANRMLATPELASRDFAWAKQLVNDNYLAEARDVLDLTLLVKPCDADVRCASGDLWLRAGRSCSARDEFTIALTLNSKLAAAYDGRAEAAARVGDRKRAGLDLAELARFGQAAGVAEHLDQLLQATTVEEKPSALLAALDAAAADGAEIEALLNTADKLQRAAAAQRVRYAEQYQEYVAQLEAVVLADPNKVDSHIALATYLYEESDNRGENVEPRRGMHPFRWQFSREFELKRALESADIALNLAPKNPSAMVVKAYIVEGLGDEPQADQLVTQAIAIAGPGDAKAARLFAEFRIRQAGRLMAQAAALRTPLITSSDSYESRYDGVYRITTTTTYNPSASDIATAAALEQQAAALMQQCRTTLEAAIKLNQGTLEGLLLSASYENWFGSRDRALDLLRQAVKENPASLVAHDHLINYLRFLGRTEDALAQEAVSWQLFETTAAPLLSMTWRSLPQAGWNSLIATLEQARQLNPADARCTAYLGQAYAQTGQRDKARALAKVAVALEMARLKLDDRGEAAKWPRHADDFALAMRKRNLLAQGAEATKENDIALAHWLASAALADRYGPDGGAEPMFDAMIPSATAPTGPSPAPVNGSTLATEAYSGAGKLLKAMGRDADAQKYLLAATKWTRQPGDMTPNVGNARGDTNFADQPGAASAEALVELAKADIAAGRWKQAADRLQAATQYNPSREMRLEINELIKKIAPHMGRP